MHLLYVDESGSSADKNQTHWIDNKIAAHFEPEKPHELELHGSPMRSGKHGWRKVPVAQREQAIKDALTVGIVKQHWGSVRLFGAVINKQKTTVNDPVLQSFEQLTSRFDMFLQRCHLKGNTQRGLMLCDDSSTETRIQTLSREFKYNGHSYGKIRNYAEVPVFLNSKASRLIQLADLVAYAMFRHYEHRDSQYFDLFKDRFDVDGGNVHGLYLDL